MTAQTLYPTHTLTCLALEELCNFFLPCLYHTIPRTEHKLAKIWTLVFIHRIAIHKSLQPPYDGPFEVIRHTPKFFTVTVNGKTQTISLDRLKLPHLEASTGTPLACTSMSKHPVSAAVPASSNPPVRATLSEHHVHFLVRFTS